MKKAKKATIAVASIVLVAVCAVGAFIMLENRAYNGETVIVEEKVYQTMNGFGTSSAWLSQEYGGWENNKEIISYLYDKEKGIGLNIYRYNLGANSKDDETIYDIGRRTEGFMNKDGSYDFTADANAQNALRIAKEFAGDDLRVTLFCNSPPTALTKNGKAYCDAVENKEYASNLSEENYDAFADYCYTCADYFTKQGYRVADISPINEPQWGWNAWYNDDGSISMNQEGCYYSVEETTKLLKAMVKRFDGSELDSKDCKISMFESGEAGGKGSQHAEYLDTILAEENTDLRNYFDVISTHSYWASNKAKQKTADYLNEEYFGYSVACTEYCQMTNDKNTGIFDLVKKEKDGTNGMTIEYGTALANTIITDLTVLNATEWDWWLGCSYGVYPDGLVYINAENHSDIQTSKRLWCLGNFSKFIDEGAQRIKCQSGIKNLKACAFKNPNGETVIVYSNSSTKDLTTSLKNINANNIEIYTTSADYNLEQTYSGEKTDELSIKAQSVVTVVIK